MPFKRLRPRGNVVQIKPRLCCSLDYSPRIASKHQRPGRTSTQRFVCSHATCEDRLRICARCLKSKALRNYPREPLEPFEFQFTCKECHLGIILPSPQQLSRGNPTVVAKQAKRVQRLLADYDYTQVRFNNTMQRLASCAAQSTDPDAAEETAVRLRDPRFFEEQMEMLSALLCISDQGSAIELVRRQVDLLLLPPDVLAYRVAALKVVVPHADVFALMDHGPWLLLLQGLQDVEATLVPALRQVQKLMPSFDVGGKVHEGTGVWWSALDIMKQTRRQYSYAE